VTQLRRDGDIRAPRPQAPSRPGGGRPGPGRGPAGRPPAGRGLAGGAAGGRDNAQNTKGVASVRRGSQLNLVASGVSAVATTAVTILITRHYPPAIAGAFFTATSIFLIVGGVAGLGTNVGLTYFIARLRSLGEEHKIPGIMRIAILPVVVASVVATAALLLLAEPLAHIMISGHGAQHGETPANVAEALRGLALMLPFAGLLNAYLGATRGYGDMRASAWVGQIGLTVARLFAVLIAVAAGGTMWIAPLWALPYLPTAAAAYWWGRRISRDHDRPYVPLPDVPPEVAALLALATPVSPSQGAKPVSYNLQASRNGAPAGRLAARRMAQNSTRGFWAFTTPRAIANTAQNILQQIDIVLVAAMKGPKEAAIYTAATRFLVLGQLGGMAINRASQTSFTELFTQGDRKGANFIYRVTTGWFVLLLWPMYLLAVIYGPVILEVFGGHGYQTGSTVIVVLGLTMLLAAACGQVDMVLITSGRSSWSLFNGLLTVGVNVGADLFLIPRYGITGAAIGWSLAIIVSNVMPLIQLAVVMGLHPFGRGTLIACVTSAVSFGVFPLTTRLLLGDGVLGIAVGVIIGCTLQGLAMRRFRTVLRLPRLPGRKLVNRLLRRGGGRGGGGGQSYPGGGRPRPAGRWAP